MATPPSLMTPAPTEPSSIATSSASLPTAPPLTSVSLSSRRGAALPWRELALHVGGAPEPALPAAGAPDAARALEAWPAARARAKAASHTCPAHHTPPYTAPSLKPCAAKTLGVMARHIVATSNQRPRERVSGVIRAMNHAPCKCARYQPQMLRALPLPTWQRLRAEGAHR